MASTPASTCGHQASMLRRASSLRALAVVEVEAHGAAATGPGNLDQTRCPGAIQHPRRGGIDVRQHRRLHAAGQRQHATRAMPPTGHGAGILHRRHLGLQRRRQQRPQSLAQLHRRRRTGRTRQQDSFQRPARQRIGTSPRQLRLDDLATDVEQARSTARPTGRSSRRRGRSGSDPDAAASCRRAGRLRAPA